MLQQLQQQQHLCLNEKLILIQFNLISIDFVFWYFYNFIFARECTSVIRKACAVCRGWCCGRWLRIRGRFLNWRVLFWENTFQPPEKPCQNRTKSSRTIYLFHPEVAQKLVLFWENTAQPPPKEPKIMPDPSPDLPTWSPLPLSCPCLFRNKQWYLLAKRALPQCLFFITVVLMNRSGFSVLILYHGCDYE